MSLIILGKVSPKVIDLIKAGLPNTRSETTVVVFIDFADSDYPIGSLFTDISKSENIRGKLIAVTQQFGKSVLGIAQGWKTICAIEFTSSIPQLIAALPEIDDWYDEHRVQICLVSEET